MFEEEKVFKKIANLFGALVAREVISAWAGHKISRVVLPPVKISDFCKLLSEIGLHTEDGNKNIFAKRDIGKGGWSNKFEETPSPSAIPDRLIYVGKSQSACNKAKSAEESGDEGSFGDQLGVPSCCIDFYLENQDRAYEKQNDYVPLVLLNTEGAYPFNYWNNYVSQYFGYSFLSFFPCSFNCMHAEKFALNTYDLIHSVYPEMAKQILHFQRQNILYTEYRGIYMFENSLYDQNLKEIELNNNYSLLATVSSNNRTLKKILDVEMIRIVNKNHIDMLKVYGSSNVLKGENVSMLIFN